MDDLRAELGCDGTLHPHGGATRPSHTTSTSLTVEQRRSIVEATKLLPTPDLASFPSEDDDAALNAMAREYLAHYGYADTIAALDRAAPPKAVHNDTAILRDKKGVLTFLARVKQGGYFDTTESIKEGQLTVGNICMNLPEDVAAQLWLWWTLRVSTWAPEQVDTAHLMAVVLRGNATGNMGSAVHLAEQCAHFIHSRHQPNSPNLSSSSKHQWRRRGATPVVSSSPVDSQHLDALYAVIRPAVHTLYGTSKRPRGETLPTALHDLCAWNAHEQHTAAHRWNTLLAND